MAESIGKADVMDFVNTLTTFAIEINKSKFPASVCFFGLKTIIIMPLLQKCS